MRNFIKTIFCISFFLSGINSFAQELNAGIGLGYNVIHAEDRIDLDEKNAATVGAVFEWRPNHAIFSLNTGARVITDPASANVAFPFYLKFIFGNKFRVCPFGGVYLNTNSNRGVTLGTSLEVPIENKWILFIQYEYYGEFFKVDFPNHWGNTSHGRDVRYAQWIGVGLKYNLLNEKE